MDDQPFYEKFGNQTHLKMVSIAINDICGSWISQTSDLRWPFRLE